MLKFSYELPNLQAITVKSLETVEILKALAHANRSLAELKGRAVAIPNQGILIDTLILQEARVSSEIENIVTTQDELFQADIFLDDMEAPAVKEVKRYRDALKFGFDRLGDFKGLIPNSTLIGMFQILKEQDSGFRQTHGTSLKNERTGEIVYVPPQDHRHIIQAMSELEKFINEDQLSSLDPLIKMALIHHQFESIHPFPDGNGRIGRILNVLYLTRTGLLEIPILYLSRFINETKHEYYRLLQNVRETKNWESWVVYILNAVDKTAQITLYLVENIRSQMAEMKRKLRKDLPRLYSQDLLNNLFRHPYTKIEYVQKDLSVSRQTASKYLDILSGAGLVKKYQNGSTNYYINEPLVNLFQGEKKQNLLSKK